MNHCTVLYFELRNKYRLKPAAAITAAATLIINGNPPGGSWVTRNYCNKSWNCNKFKPMRKGTPLIIILTMIFFGCEPLVTTFDDIEEAVLYKAKNISGEGVVPQNSKIEVMAWNIRFAIGRLPFFGDSCGKRTIFTEDEVMDALDLIAAKVNELDPDIILFQEIDRESKRSAYIDQVQWLLDHTNLNYGAYASMWQAQVIPSDGIGGIDAGNAILSKWEIESAERIQLPLRGDQDALTLLFYLRRNVLKAKIAIPGQDDFYAVNTHSTAFATDDTKQKHIDTFYETLQDIDENGYVFISGGDLNSIPPGADSTDFCMEDMCSAESFHTDADGGPHREGSYFNNFVNEPMLLEPLYNAYTPAIPHQDAVTSSHMTHSTDGSAQWDRKLDYIFTNLSVVENSGHTHQNTLMLSDHAPVTATVVLP